jgi:hypothetical protein
MLAAGARADVLTKKQWSDYCNRFATKALTPGANFSAATDRAVELMLDAQLSFGEAEESVIDIVSTVANWMAGGRMRLWRIVPYMQVRLCWLLYVPLLLGSASK